MFEQVLYNHLMTFTNELTPYLAVWNGNLAIFNTESPADTDENWGTNSQYGRIIFTVNMKDDPERNVSGTLMVDVICQSGKQSPEELEHLVKPLIDGYFFTDEIQTIAAQWLTSNYFTDVTRKEEGFTITYGLLAFPSQTTNAPDPINLLNEYTKELYPNTCVIGLDSLNEAWKPTLEMPAIYWRLTNVSRCLWIPSTYACKWQTANCQAHIFSPQSDIEVSIAREIMNNFSMKKVLRFADNTTLRIDTNITIAPGADPLKRGQLSMEATYGILTDNNGRPLEHIYVNGKESTDG